MVELTFLKQANQKSVVFFTIGILQIKVLSINQMSAMDAINLMQNTDLTEKCGTL